MVLVMLITVLAIIRSTTASFTLLLATTRRWGLMSRIAMRSVGLIFEAMTRASIAVSRLWPVVFCVV